MVLSIILTAELQEFRKIIDEFISIAETIVTEVEQEKSHAIAAQNLLKSMAKQRDAEKQEIQVILYFPLCPKKSNSRRIIHLDQVSSNQLISIKC